MIARSMRTPGTLLIVDDDANDQLMIESALRQAAPQWSIRTVGDGAEAIAYLKGDGIYADRDQHPYPAMIITDLKMPRVDGLAVLEFLQSRPRSAIVPTIVFSASSDPDDIAKSYALGASCYHVKPSSAERFAALLRRLHDYWSACEVPEVDRTGVRKVTDSTGRIGRRYSSDPFPSLSSPASPDAPS